ncbi:hypothetical protein LJB71_03170 [Thermomonas sp. S9]|uniref:hypothetical protein n=1 Tax=Thermomonas sp. S9 TaxID=2885203 RepID=UPI00286FD9C4|nr:hypothetical protein [Thermomonas sp. S9]MCR6495334.1 hypothetical protein [Thermomonas sp. S9]
MASASRMSTSSPAKAKVALMFSSSRGQVQAERLLGIGQGQAVDVGGRLGELAGGLAELLVEVELVHGGLLRGDPAGIAGLCAAA